MTTWILFGRTAHVVALTEENVRTTTCGGVFHGYDGLAEMEDMTFPPEACHSCRMTLAMAELEPEPLDVALRRGFEAG